MQISRINLSGWINKLAFCLIVVCVLFSCQKENFDVVETTTDEIVPEINHTNALMNRMSSQDTSALFLGCFSLQTPFSLVDIEGEEYVVNSEEDFTTLFENEEVPIVNFVYPLQIIYEDGTEATINNDEELGEAFVSCLPDDGWDFNEFPAYNINFDNSCYQLTYPLTLLTIDSITIAVADEQEFAIVLAEHELLFFNFPLELLDEEQNTVIATSVDDLFILLGGCSGFEGDSIDLDFEFGLFEIACYGIQYPVQVELIDGSVVTVEDHEKLCDLMLEGTLVDFVFPYTLIDEEGDIILISSEEELYIAIDECENFDPISSDDLFLLYLGAADIDSSGVGSCYSINFPLMVTAFNVSDESTEEIEISDILAIEEIIFNTSENHFYELEYPVSVTLNSTAEIVILNSVDDLEELFFNCN